MKAISIAKNSKETGKPFFTYLSYLVPHAPLSASKHWEEKAGKSHNVWGNARYSMVFI